MKKLTLIASMVSCFMSILCVIIENIYGYLIWFPIFLLCLLYYTSK